MVQEAQELKWKHLYVKGSDGFNSQVWEEATDRGIAVHGYQPTAAQRLARAEKKNAAQSSPPAKAVDNSIRRARALDRADSLVGRWVERGRQWGSKLAKMLTANSALAADTPNSIEYIEPPVRHAAHQKRSLDVALNADALAHIDRTTVPEKAIKGLYARQGNTGIYLHPGTKAEAFRDEGLKLSTRGEDLRVINSLVQIAAAREWKTITVQGSDSFRRETWLRATYRGIEVQGFEPSQADRSQLAGMLERARHAASRNDTQEHKIGSAATAPSPSVETTDAHSKGTPAESKPMQFGANPPSKPSSSVKVSAGEAEAGAGKRERLGLPKRDVAEARDKAQEYMAQNRNSASRESDRNSQNGPHATPASKDAGRDIAA
jgi:hypothetical protein